MDIETIIALSSPLSGLLGIWIGARISYNNQKAQNRIQVRNSLMREVKELHKSLICQITDTILLKKKIEPIAKGYPYIHETAIQSLISTKSSYIEAENALASIQGIHFSTIDNQVQRTDLEQNIAKLILRITGQAKEMHGQIEGLIDKGQFNQLETLRNNFSSALHNDEAKLFLLINKWADIPWWRMALL